MKRLICVFGFLGLFGVNEVSAEAWRYEMQYEKCNRVDTTFMVCRRTELYVGCSVPAQTLCPGYGMASIQ
jgi:hypothetical protein